MNLIDYCVVGKGTGKQTCLVLAGVARRAKCSVATLYMIAMGHKQAGPKLANKIEAATTGKVTRYDLRPDVFGPAPAADRSEAA